MQLNMAQIWMDVVFLIGGVYMRVIGTMWQTGVLTGKPCTFCGPEWVIFGVLALQNTERLLRGSDVKWHIPSTCLDAFKSVFPLEFVA